MASVSSLPTFEKLLDETNYATWKFQMELYLVHDGLWKYTKVTPEGDEFELQQDQLARAKIGLMVESDCIIYLRQTKNAREAWEALRNAFDDSGVNKTSRLLAQLVSLKLEQFETIKQYVTAVMSVAQELKDAGKEVDDELLATILLQGLTKEYAPYRLTIENTSNALTTEYVKTKLLSLEDQHTAKEDNDFCRLHMAPKRHRKSTRGKQAECRICGSYHAVRDCPELSVSIPLRREKSKPKPGYGATYSQNDGSNMEWLMDSGDYAHMTNRRDYPCFLVCARMTVCCLVKIFKLW